MAKWLVYSALKPNDTINQPKNAKLSQWNLFPVAMYVYNVSRKNGNFMSTFGEVIKVLRFSSCCIDSIFSVHYDINFPRSQTKECLRQTIKTPMPYILHTFLHIFSKTNRFGRHASLLRAEYTKSANKLLLYTNVGRI